MIAGLHHSSRHLAVVLGVGGLAACVAWDGLSFLILAPAMTASAITVVTGLILSSVADDQED